MQDAIRFRAPLLWLLCALLAGFFLDEIFSLGSALFLVIAGGIGAVIALALTYGKHQKAAFIWSVVFLTTAALISCGYYIHRLNPPPQDWQWLPPREADLIVKTERIFQTNDRFGRATGIVVIKKAPVIMKELEGQKAYFQVKLNDAENSPVKSEIFHLRGIIGFIGENREPGSFDHYLNKTGTYFELRRGFILERLEPANPFYRFCNTQNDKFEAILRLGATDENEWQNAYAAMLLGKKSTLSQMQRGRYLASGTMHFFAISGLHVGAAAMVIYYFFLLLRLPRSASAPLGLAILLLYVQITGGSPSAMRAFLMVAVFWGSSILVRKPAPLSALVLSALLVLAMDPLQLWNSGFQLSYAVVGAILLYGLPLGKKLANIFQPFRGLPEISHTWGHRKILTGSRKLAELFAVSLSTGIMSSPLTIEYFQIFTPGAVFLNLILVPMVGLLVAGGFVSLFFGLLQMTWLSAFFNHGPWLIIWFIDAMIDFFQKTPGFFWPLDYRWHNTGQITVLILLGLMLAGHGKKWRPSGLAFCLPPFILGIILILSTTVID